MSAASAPSLSPAFSRLGRAWVLHALALAAHVIDEALTGFLTVYNPSIWAIRPASWWFPPTFTFRVWLTGLICAVIILLALSPFFYRNVRWVRPLGYFMGVLNISNALGHTIATILGHTVLTVRFPRPAPGFYSSPFLLAASIYLLIQLANTRTRIVLRCSDDPMTR